MKHLILLILYLSVFLSCKNTELSQVSIINKTYDFGTLNYGDSVTLTFEIKNISSVPYQIGDIATSCGCTSSEHTTSEVSMGEFANVKVVYTPFLEDVGKEISKSVVVSDNSKDGFHVLYIKGKVE